MKTLISYTTYILSDPYTFTCLLPYALTFSPHVDHCQYKWWLDTASWLSVGVREVTCLHALLNSEVDSRSGPGGGRPDARLGLAQCQQSPSSGQNQECGRSISVAFSWKRKMDSFLASNKQHRGMHIEARFSLNVCKVYEGRHLAAFIRNKVICEILHKTTE